MPQQYSLFSDNIVPDFDSKLDDQAVVKKAMASSEKLQLAPMLRQYVEVKENYPEHLLLFQVGDFFEVFFDDAKTVSECLSIRLTSRDKDKEEPIPMCGVPIHALENYIPKLLAAGFSCVLVEQVEEAGASKGPVKREITRIVTPAVRFDNEGLDEKSFSFVSGLYFYDENLVLSLFDVSTGKLIVYKPSTPRDFEAFLFRYAPREIVIDKDSYESRDGDKFKETVRDFVALTKTRLVYSSSENIEYSSLSLEEEASNVFKNIKDEGSLKCVQILLSYVQSLAVSTKVLVSSLILEDSVSRPPVLDASTRRNLELCESTLDGSKRDSLLGVIDKTRTASGGRLLYEWILSPLVEIEDILERQNAISELIESKNVLDSIRDALSGVRDLDRLSIRLMNGRISPYELGQLRDTLEVVPGLMILLEGLSGGIWERVKTAFLGVEESHKILSLSLSESLPSKVGEGDIFKSEFNEELDRLRSLKGDTQVLLNELEQRERDSSGINTLRVKHNSVFGFFIEISKGQAKNAPAHYIRRQTLTNAERYSTKELADIEVEINSAEVKYRQLELHLFKELKCDLQPHVLFFRKLSSSLALLDVLCSLALIARQGNYIKPTLTEESKTVVKNARHPVVEAVIGRSDFVPNDVSLGQDGHRFAVLTGPNMGGKSTYLRQVGIIQILAQMGSFVPAEEALIGIADKIFTRIGANDALTRGESTFMVEMKEASTILNEASSRSLVLIDEVGRGTSTTDGLAIASAIAKHLLESNQCRTIFATHFFELTSMPDESDNCFSLSAGIVQTKAGLKFSHRIEQRKGSGSYGLHVARLAGVPEEVVKYAESLIGKDWAVTASPEVVSDDIKSAITSEMNEILEMLSGLNLDNLTPLEALNSLYKLKSRAQSVNGH